MLASGQDTSSLDDEAFSVEAVQDRCILRLIASCCNGKFALLMKLPFFTILLPFEMFRKCEINFMLGCDAFAQVTNL